MFGIADYGAFCAAILVFLALPGPGTFALLTSTAKGGLRAGAAASAFANLVSAQVRAHRRIARVLERLAGIFLMGFGIRLGTQ